MQAMLVLSHSMINMMLVPLAKSCTRLPGRLKSPGLPPWIAERRRSASVTCPKGLCVSWFFFYETRRLPTAYIIHTFFGRSLSLEARPHWSWLGLASGHFILVSETGSSVHSKMGSLFFYFQRFDISHGDTGWDYLEWFFWWRHMGAEESRKKKKKTTYKANDGNWSLTVLGEIISFVTLFFSFFLFSFCFTCFLQSLLDQHIRREQCASQFEPSVFPSCTPCLLRFFVTFLTFRFFTSSTVSFTLVPVYSM